MIVTEAIRCRLQGMLWARFRELVLMSYKPREGFSLWRVFLEDNQIRTLVGVDFLIYNRGQGSFVAVSCPVTPNACLMIPKDLANKMLLLDMVP